MPLSDDNFKDLCKSRDDWLRRVESHLRQSLTAATTRHNHFTVHGGYTRVVDSQAVEFGVQVIIAALAENKAPASQSDTT